MLAGSVEESQLNQSTQSVATDQFVGRSANALWEAHAPVNFVSPVNNLCRRCWINAAHVTVEFQLTQQNNDTNQNAKKLENKTLLKLLLEPSLSQ